MNIKDEVASYKNSVEDELKSFFKEKKSVVKIPHCLAVIENIEEYTLRGGKRLRAILMIMGYKLIKEENEDIIKTSTALELIQSYFLLHDDIMDESDLRRGKPTLHKIYGKKHSDKDKAIRFGENIGILAGDLANAYSHEIIANSNFSDTQKLRAFKKMNSLEEYTGYGQVLDIYSEVSDDFSEDNLLQVHLYKTAKYTVEGPLHLGAILADAPDEVLQILSDYAIPVGIAFQIQDDILGLFGTEEEIGKPIDSDLAEGKKTLLILKALEKGSSEDKTIINNILGKRNITSKEVEKVREIVKNTGALKDSQIMAEKEIEKALAALYKLKDKIKNQDALDFLKWLASYVITREY